MLEFLKLVTIVTCSFIILSTLYSIYYVNKQKKENALNAKRQWIEQNPSIISTMGVLGTFLGITIGLMGFNPNDLNNSIPLLLSGLKTAFFTSLAGMIGSLILTRIVNHSFDEINKEENNTGSSTDRIVRAINELKVEISNNYSTNLTQITEMIEQIKDDIEELNGYGTTINESANHISQKVSQMSDLVSNISSSSLTTAESAATIDNNTTELIDKIDELKSTISESN